MKSCLVKVPAAAVCAWLPEEGNICPKAFLAPAGIVTSADNIYLNWKEELFDISL